MPKVKTLNFTLYRPLPHGYKSQGRYLHYRRGRLRISRAEYLALDSPVGVMLEYDLDAAGFRITTYDKIKDKAKLPEAGFRRVNKDGVLSVTLDMPEGRYLPNGEPGVFVKLK